MKTILLIDRFDDRFTGMEKTARKFVPNQIALYTIRDGVKEKLAHKKDANGNAFLQWERAEDWPTTFDLILVHGRDKDLIANLSANVTVWYGNVTGMDPDQPKQDRHESIYRPINSQEEALTADEFEHLLQFSVGQKKPAILLPGDTNDKFRSLVRILENLMSIPDQSFDQNQYEYELKRFSDLANLPSDLTIEANNYPADIEKIHRNGNQVAYYRKVYSRIAEIRDTLYKIGNVTNK